MRLTMKRLVNDRERWYRLEVVPNLFDEWLLIRSFGSMYKATPLGIICQTFPDMESVDKACIQLTQKKSKRGYTQPEQEREN